MAHLATNGAWGFFPLVLLLLVVFKAFFGLVEPGAIWAGNGLLPGASLEGFY